MVLIRSVSKRLITKMKVPLLRRDPFTISSGMMKELRIKVKNLSLKYRLQYLAISASSKVTFIHFSR